MYAYIKGKIVTKSENYMILENNGIGYGIICSTNTISNLSYDTEVCIHTYMQVKEDGVTLFGFETTEEKEMFMKLISVSGVGGKTAIQILSGARLDELISAIMNGDVRVLKGVKGIGKKIAELICVTLKENLSDIAVPDLVNTGMREGISATSNQDLIDDVCEVLKSLGLKKAEAMKLIKLNYTGTEDEETLISKCLKNRTI